MPRGQGFVELQFEPELLEEDPPEEEVEPLEEELLEEEDPPEDEVFLIQQQVLELF